MQTNKEKSQESHGVEKFRENLDDIKTWIEELKAMKAAGLSFEGSSQETFIRLTMTHIKAQSRQDLVTAIEASRGHSVDIVIAGIQHISLMKLLNDFRGAFGGESDTHDGAHELH